MILAKIFKKFNIRRDRVIQCYQGVFRTPVGKVVLMDLCRMCHIDEPTFHNDALEMARREGERRVALHIMNMLSLNPSEYLHSIDGEM